MMTWMRAVTAFATAGTLFVASASGAAPATRPAPRPEGIVNDAPRPKLDVPHCRQVPRLLAEVGDPAWAAAATIDHLELSLGATPIEQVPATQVKLLWDEKYLYIRFICADDRLESPFHERDEDHYKGDVVEVFLDPVGDARQYIELQVGPDNQVLDQLMLLTADARSGEDLRLVPDVYPRNVWPIREWNMPELRTAASHQVAGDKLQGWTVDIAIPAAPLLQRLAAREFVAREQLRINLLRYEHLPREGDTPQFVPLNWAPVLAGCPHFSPAAMGWITLVP